MLIKLGEWELTVDWSKLKITKAKWKWILISSANHWTRIETENVGLQENLVQNPI